MNKKYWALVLANVVIVAVAVMVPAAVAGNGSTGLGKYDEYRVSELERKVGGMQRKITELFARVEKLEDRPIQLHEGADLPINE